LDRGCTAEAFGGMIDLIQKGKTPNDGRAPFWHTGGWPALFAYAEQFLRS
jgi:1-aminocyclopropane-1-carboxylate deaminase/D-cysteine desulfhydrase-like pyridoxal-dependent ACC family enzyme